MRQPNRQPHSWIADQPPAATPTAAAAAIATTLAANTNGKRVFIASISTVLLTSLLLFTVVSSSWTDEGYRTQTCHCLSLPTATQACPNSEVNVNLLQVGSLVAGALEALAVVVMLRHPKRTKLHKLISLSLFSAVLVQVAAIYAFFDLFQQGFCDAREREDLHLNYAFYSRVLEVLLVIIVFFMTLGGRKPRGYSACYLTILSLYLCIFTTSLPSGGWAASMSHGIHQQYSLWESCICASIKTKAPPCVESTRLLRAAQSFEVLGTAAMIYLTAMVIGLVKAPRFFSALLGWISFSFLTLPWVLESALLSFEFCGKRFNGGNEQVGHFWIRAAIPVFVGFLSVLLGKLEDSKKGKRCLVPEPMSPPAQQQQRLKQG